jgi:hypothetical protein
LLISASGNRRALAEQPSVQIAVPMVLPDGPGAPARGDVHDDVVLAHDVLTPAQSIWPCARPGN